MPEKKINIVYIDDNSDEILSRYMNENYCTTPFHRPDATQIEKNYEEVHFCGDEGYEALLKNPIVKAANVILIDNHLFEERTVGIGRFSGKQFKIILRKIFPYVEVVIITQDETLSGENVIRKFSGRHGEDPSQYYQEHLAPCLDRAIEEVLGFEDLADDLRQSTDVGKVLVDKILNSLQGNDSYDELSKSDIDELIHSFRELKDAYGNK
jgi:hypothetical protein